MSSKDNAASQPKKKKPNNFFYDFVKITGAIPMLLWFRPKVVKAGKTDPRKIKGSGLIVANHINFFDPVCVLLAFGRRRVRFLATKDLYHSKWLHFFFTHINCIQVDKQNFDVQTLHASVDALQSGQMLTIFPEGTINHDDPSQLLPFKKGAVTIAHRANAPIIPVYLAPRKSKWARQIIVMGDPIHLQDVCGEKPSYLELKKASVYLHDKETELIEYYNARYAKGKKA